MKILFLNDTACGPHFGRLGMARVFAHVGHQVHFWNPAHQPALQLFADWKPDLFMGQTYTLDRPLLKALARSPETRVVLYCSAWGEAVKNIDRQQYPIDLVGDAQKVAVSELKQATGRPDFVWLHLAERWVEPVIGGWRELGVEPVGLLNGFDSFSYTGGKRRDDLVCDAGLVSGWWPYKGRNLDPYMGPLLHPDSGIRCKVFGNQPWSSASFLGPIDEEDVKDLFVSATVCPSISEPHSIQYGYDIVERNFKVPGAGGFLISDKVRSLEEDVFTEGEVLTASTPKEFHDLVRYFVAHPDERLPYIEKARKTVLRSHCYFHRAAEVFRRLGLTEEEGKVRRAYDEEFAKW